MQAIAVFTILLTASLICIATAAVVWAGARQRDVGRVVALSTFCVGMWNAQIALQSWPWFADEFPFFLDSLRLFAFVIPAAVYHVAIAWTDHWSRVV